VDYGQIAKMVVSWMGIPDGWVLSLDRTTWEFGSHCYNILTNGIVHEGVANPVLWWLLDKKGNSNSDERMRLPVAFYQLFPKAQISVFVCRPACLLVRHGFVICCAGPLYRFVSESEPLIRLNAQERLWQPKWFLPISMPGESQLLLGVCRVWGYPVSVEAQRLDDGQ